MKIRKRKVPVVLPPIISQTEDNTKSVPVVESQPKDDGEVRLTASPDLVPAKTEVQND
jgi:hypothetical protein